MKNDNRELPRIAIIIPCYNEEAVLPETAPMFLDELKLMIDKGKINDNSRILFVNDGSKDETWNIICSLHESDPDFFSGVNLLFIRERHADGEVVPCPCPDFALAR